MNLFFSLLTVFFCLTCVGPKNQVDMGQAKDSTVQVWDSNDLDSDERFELPLIPLIHNFLFLPATNFVSTPIAQTSFSLTFLQEIISEVSATGPPRV